VLSALLKYPGIIAAMPVGTIPSDACKMHILSTLPQHSHTKKLSCGKIPLTLTRPPQKKKVNKQIICARLTLKNCP
jgi:hypothetical protein